MDVMRKRPIKGHLKVSQDVITTVARLAAEETSGVAGLGSSAVSFRHLFLRMGKNRAVSMVAVGDVVTLSLSILIKWGHSASQVAERVQARVKADVQEMTGIAVSRVNVTAAGVVFPGQVSLPKMLKKGK